jgi:hypothetical protein
MKPSPAFPTIGSMAVLSYQMAIIISDYQQRPKFAETKSRKLLLSPLRYCSRAKLVGTVYPKVRLFFTPHSHSSQYAEFGTSQ